MNELREALNSVYIEGTLLENKLELKEINGKEAIVGELDIETEKGTTHTVKTFSYKYKLDGSENSVFKGLVTVMNEFKSVAKYGEEEADKIKITNGKITINDYYGQDGQLRSLPQITSNFFNRVSKNEGFNPKAELEVEVFIHKFIEEIDKQTEEETGRLIIKGLVPLYGGKIAPIDFIVEKPEYIQFITSTYEEGDTVKLYAELVNKVEITKTVEEVGFGKPREKIKRKFINEIIVTGGSPEPYDEESPNKYSVETIKKALTEREIYLEELKNKKNETQAEERPKGKRQLPF